MTCPLRLTSTLLLCLVALGNTCVSAASENSVNGSGVITWKDPPSGVSYNSPDEYDEGEAPLPTTWSMVNTWIRVVSPGEVPYDLITDAMGGEFEVSDVDIMEFSDLLFGFAICFVIGLLFLFIFPIVACCFCSCRLCCGKCGGKMYQRQSGNERCKVFTFVVILAVITAMLAAACACAYHVNARQSSEFTNFGENVADSMDDLVIFVNNTVDEILFVAVNQTMWTLDLMLYDLLNVGTGVGVPVREALRPYIDPAVDAILDMTDTIEETRDGLEELNTLVTDLDADYSALTASLDALVQDVEDMYSDCAGAGGCSSAGQDPQNTASTSQLVAGRNFSDLPLSGVGPGYYPRTVVDVKITSLTNIVNNDLASDAVKGQQEFEDIPELVNNETVSAAGDLMDSYGDFSDEIEGGLDPMIDNLNSALSEGSSFGNTISEEVSPLKEYNDYRSLAMLCLYLIVMAVVVLNTLGVIFGVIGSNFRVAPTKRGMLSNIGGLLLMSSAGLCFIFATLFMVLTSFPFIIGAPIHKLVCEPVVSGDLFVHTIDTPDAIPGTDGYFLASILFGDGDIPLTMSGILEDCEEGAAAFTAFKLENMVNLTDMLNVDQYISDDQFAGLKVNISDQIVIMSPTTRDNLADARDVNAAGIPWSDFETELNSDLIDYGEDLNDFADDLQSYIDAHSGDSSVFPGAYETTFTDMVATIRDFQTDSVDPVVADRDTVKTAVDQVQTDSDAIDSDVNDTIAAGENADDYINNNLDDVIASEVETFKNKLFGYTTQFIDYVEYMVYYELGSCLPMANLIKNLLNTVCRGLLDPFNAFWFCNGWVTVFFVLNIIFAVRLAKFFRRMEEADEIDDDIPLVNSGGEAPPPGYGHNRVAPAYEDDFVTAELRDELKHLDEIPAIIAGENMSKSKGKGKADSAFQDLPPGEPTTGEAQDLPGTSGEASPAATPDGPGSDEQRKWYEVPDHDPGEGPSHSDQEAQQPQQEAGKENKEAENGEVKSALPGEIPDEQPPQPAENTDPAPPEESEPAAASLEESGPTAASSNENAATEQTNEQPTEPSPSDSTD